jgi:hypothetical protein
MNRPLYPPGKNPSTRWTEGWVDPRVSLDSFGDFLSLLGFEPRNIQPVANHYIGYTRMNNKTEIIWKRPSRNQGNIPLFAWRNDRKLASIADHPAEIWNTHLRNKSIKQCSYNRRIHSVVICENKCSTHQCINPRPHPPHSVQTMYVNSLVLWHSAYLWSSMFAPQRVSHYQYYHKLDMILTLNKLQTLTKGYPHTVVYSQWDMSHIPMIPTLNKYQNNINCYMHMHVGSLNLIHSLFDYLLTLHQQFQFFGNNWVTLTRL